MTPDPYDLEIPPTEGLDLGPDDFKDVLYGQIVQGAMIRALRRENDLLRQQIAALREARSALRTEAEQLREMMSRDPRRTVED